MATKSSRNDSGRLAVALTSLIAAAAASAGCGPSSLSGWGLLSSPSSDATVSSAATAPDADPDAQADAETKVDAHTARAAAPADATKPDRFRLQRLSLAGAATAYANDINNRGLVVGWRPHPQWGRIAAAWRNGRLLDLGRLNNMTSEAFAVDDAGVIVGWCRRHNEAPHPFVMRDGVLVETPMLEGFDEASFFGVGQGKLAAGSATRGTGRSAAVVWTGQSTWEDESLVRIPLKGADSAAHDMNRNGRVVGEVTSQDGKIHAFLWNPGDKPTLLPGVDGYVGKAYAINDADEVAGGVYLSDTHHAGAHWKGGKLQTLPGLKPDLRSWALAINGRGWIAGWSAIEPGSNDQHAVVWHQGAPIDLNDRIDEAAELILAKSVNDRGQIVAMGKDSEGYLFPVVLTPVQSDAQRADSEKPTAKPAIGPRDLAGAWVIDWVQTAEREEGDAGKEKMFISYLAPWNKALLFRPRSGVRSYHCPLLSEPIRSDWPWNPRRTSGDVIQFGRDLRVESLGADRILVTRGDEPPEVYVRDRFSRQPKGMVPDKDAIADFIESQTSRMIRLTERYDWSSLSPESRRYLQSCVERIEGGNQQVPQDEKAASMLAEMKWRASWIRKRCLAPPE